MKLMMGTALVWSLMPLFLLSAAEADIAERKFEACFTSITKELTRNKDELSSFPIVALDEADQDVLVFLRDKIKIAPGLLFGYAGYTYDTRELKRDFVRWQQWLKLNRHRLRFNEQQGIYLSQ